MYIIYKEFNLYIKHHLHSHQLCLLSKKYIMITKNK